MWSERNANLPLGRVASYIQARLDKENHYKIASVAGVKGII